MRSDELWRSVDRVLPAVSSDPKEPALRCVLVDVGDRSLRLVATDKRRLAVSEVALLDGEPAPFRVLVPADALASIREDLGGSTVDLGVDGGALQLRTDAGTYEVPLVAGDFPAYERFLAADETATTAVVDRAALVAAIEASADDGPLLFRFTDGAIEIGEPSPVRVGADHARAGVSFHLDPALAHDAVRGAPGADVAIEASTPASPIVVRTPSDEGYTAVVMPVRVHEPRARRARR